MGSSRKDKSPPSKATADRLLVKESTLMGGFPEWDPLGPMEIVTHRCWALTGR